MAATNEQIVSFIKELGNLAVAECNRRAAAGGGFVLPSVCIAQAAHETGWGTSGRMTKANAYFGIKAGGSWTGKVFTADTWEVKDGESYNTVANFRAYDSKADSVRDYYDLIVNNSRYAAGVSTLQNRLTPEAALTAIWAGGYATDDLYVPNVMNLLNGRDLDQWDEKVTGIASDTVPNYDYAVPAPTPDSDDYMRFKFIPITSEDNIYS